MTTTPPEPHADPEAVPSGDREPIDPGNEPGVDPPVRPEDPTAFDSMPPVR